VSFLYDLNGHFTNGVSMKIEIVCICRFNMFSGKDRIDEGMGLRCFDQAVREFHEEGRVFDVTVTSVAVGSNISNAHSSRFTSRLKSDGRPTHRYVDGEKVVMEIPAVTVITITLISNDELIVKEMARRTAALLAKDSP